MGMDAQSREAMMKELNISDKDISNEQLLRKKELAVLEAKNAVENAKR